MEIKREVYPSWNLHTDMVQDWAYFDNAFTSDQCDQIIAYCRGLGLEESKIGYDFEGNFDIRQSKIAFVPPTEFMVPYYQRLSDIVLSLNEQYFKFDLHGFGENLQFAEYEAPGGRYNSHADRAYGVPIRKLSIVLQLTDPDTYEGGNLEILASAKLPRTRGTLLAFPSYQVHRVTPVTKGTRNSLVGWINGKQFK